MLTPILTRIRVRETGWFYLLIILKLLPLPISLASSEGQVAGAASLSASPPSGSGGVLPCISVCRLQSPRLRCFFCFTPFILHIFLPHEWTHCSLHISAFLASCLIILPFFCLQQKNALTAKSGVFSLFDGLSGKMNKALHPSSSPLSSLSGWGGYLWHKRVPNLGAEMANATKWSLRWCHAPDWAFSPHVLWFRLA